MKNILAEISVSYSCMVPRSQRHMITKSEMAYQIFKDYWNMNTIELQEEFNVLFLNRANEVLGIFNISKGGTNATIVDAKLIFGPALKVCASSIVLSHNHPSGSLRPSETDIKLTQKLRDAGKLLDINLLDHLIITKFGYYSFADNGDL